MGFQQWRRVFVSEFGREPRVWFDKACIDQKDIEADLRGLPIFLSGSKRLVLLCGQTYLRRLWCIIELFTYFHIGANIDQVILVPLICEDGRHSDGSGVQEAF